MLKKHLLKSFAALSCAVMLLLTGCQNTPDTSAKSTETSETNQDTGETAHTSAGTGDTITVNDAKGEVTIPASPQKIVDISGNSDILSVLGYKVAGTANSDAYDYTKFPTYLEDVYRVPLSWVTACRIPWMWKAL